VVGDATDAMTSKERNRVRTILACIVLVWSSTNAFAQAPNALLTGASVAKDLEFPTKVSPFGFFSVPEMAVYKPDGTGPFPALVLHHQCNGLGQGSTQNVSMLDWAKLAVARGYVAFVIDSLGPRSVKTVCLGAQGGVTHPRQVRDTLQAAAHLARFEFVDKDRIALMGFSWGAMGALLASRNSWSGLLAPGPRFAAAIAFYPACMARPAGGTPYDIVNPDIDRPALVLMGDKDNETPATECIPKLEAAKAAGAPVEWHVYPEATHCWDCRHLDGASKIDGRGTRVVYRFDEDVTSDSARRMFEFIERALAPR
jgi:dienelactone hydrolase